MNKNSFNNFIFTNLSLNDIQSLINDSYYSFLPSVQNPHLTADLLIEKFAQDQNFNIYGFIKDGKPVSYIIALSHKNSNQIAIGPMFVTGQYRGNNLGKRQLQEFIKLYQAKGIEQFYTKTWLANGSSRKIFSDLGFTEINRIPHDRINGDTTITYMKNVSKE